MMYQLTTYIYLLRLPFQPSRLLLRGVPFSKTARLMKPFRRTVLHKHLTRTSIFDRRMKTRRRHLRQTLRIVPTKGVSMFTDIKIVLYSLS